LIYYLHSILGMGCIIQIGILVFMERTFLKIYLRRWNCHFTMLFSYYSNRKKQFNNLMQFTLTWKEHIPARTSASSMAHKWGLGLEWWPGDPAVFPRSLRRLKLSRKLLRNRSILDGDRPLWKSKRKKLIRLFISTFDFFFII